MRLWKLAGTLLLFGSAGTPQDLAPEVILLARIKTHMRDELARLPNYTCLETISRFHRDTANAGLKPLDTVRLEVVYSDHREWYGSPGNRDLDNSNPARLIGSGMMGSGPFASALHNILGGAHFEYRGKEALGDRTAIRYDFQFPRQPAAFEITIVGGSGTVGEKGSLWVDPESFDVLRLEANADEIPAYLPLAEQTTAVNYARTHIGDGTALLAQEGDLRLVQSNGEDNFDHFEFTHCRAFSAQSAISFDTSAVDAVSAATPPAKAAVTFLPAILQVTVQLGTPVSNGDAVGQLIEGRVVGDVRSRGKVVVKDGAVVRGRIRRLEHYQGKTKHDVGDFIVGLEFTEVEANAGTLPFYADLLSMDRRPDIRPSLSESVPAGDVTITLSELPGVAQFFVNGPAFTLPAGFKTVWRTRGPIRGM